MVGTRKSATEQCPYNGYGGQTVNFSGHSLLGLLVGSIAALVVATIAPASFGLPFPIPAAVLVLVYLGAVYPDVDLRDSIPRKHVRPYIGALVVAGVTLLAIRHWSWFVAAGETALAVFDLSGGPALAGGLALGSGALVAVLLVDPALSVLTGTHRTRTHSLLANGLIASAIAILIWLVAPDQPIVALLPFAFVIGVAVHRVADDL